MERDAAGRAFSVRASIVAAPLCQYVLRRRSNGEFPARLDEDGINEANSRYTSYVVQRDEAAQAQRSQEEQAQESLRVTKGSIFATALAKDEKWDAHYAGAGVKLGDAGRS